MSESLNGPGRPAETGRLEAVLGHQRPPGADSRQQPDDDRRRVLARRRLKRLRDDHHADPEHDGHPGVDRDRPRDPGQRAGQADDA